MLNSQTILAKGLLRSKAHIHSLSDDKHFQQFCANADVESLKLMLEETANKKKQHMATKDTKTKIKKAAAKVTAAKDKLKKTLVKASKEETKKPKEAPKLYREVPNSPIMLGRTYTECVHGVTGVATMYAVHLTGCNRVLLSRVKDKTSAYSHLDEVWTDETTILDENNEFVVPQDAATPPGHCGDHESANILGNPTC